MPEGDTIWRTAEMLRGALEGKRIEVAKPAALKRFAGKTVTEVKPVGKHLLIRFDNGLALHSHMRMQGAWHVYKQGERWRRPEWQAKALLQTTDGVVAVCFSAPIIDLVKDEATVLGHLGPDILGADWSMDEVLSRARKTETKTIGELLLDQRISAGVGNVFRCEVLWRRKLSPFKPPKEVTDDELKALFETAREAMLASMKTGHRNRSVVHGRGGRPCPRCGTRIQVRALGEQARLVYWCPKCQT